MPQAQVNAIIVGLLCRIYSGINPMAVCDPNTLLAEAKCFVSRSQNEILAIQAQLLCEILQGGAAGQTCIIGCAPTGPVIPGPCLFSIAYSPGPNPGYWLWDENRGVWDEVLAPGP